MFVLTNLQNIISKEEKFWRQRSIINWLKEGDQKIRFFHLSTLKHRDNKKNFGLKKGHNLLTKENDISTEAVSFFSSLLSWNPMLSVVDHNEIVSYLP